MRYRARAIALFFVAGLSFADAPAVQPAKAERAPLHFVPFGAFIASVKNAAPARYIGRADSRIADAAAFARMRRYILDMYRDTHATSSYVLGGQYFDCIPVAQQSSMRTRGLAQPADPPPYPAGPKGSVPAPSVPQTWQDRTADAFGNAIGCTPGNIPMRRITLEEMARFGTLEKFLEK